jgi:enamine deaminase RidA (YjgF/YER057c/UK114 family)
MIIMLIALALAGCISAPQKPPTCFHLAEASETSIGYCQAIRTDNRLYISGIAGQGEMSAAVHSVYDRLQKTLEQNGLKFSNVVKENVYTTDLDAFKASGEIRKGYYQGRFPAASWVQVQRLFVPSLIVEVELVAEYPK